MTGHGTADPGDRRRVDYVRRAQVTKRLWLSFDDWNVWSARAGELANGHGSRPKLLEEVYNLEDELLAAAS